MKNKGQIEQALVELEAMQSGIGAQPLLSARHCYEVAECSRLLKRWEDAHHWHDRGEEALVAVPPGTEQQRWRVMHVLGRGFVHLDRGMIEEAMQAVVDAEQAGLARVDEREVHEARAKLELRVMRLLDQPRGARRALREFEARFRPNRVLRILCAMVIRHDPLSTVAEQEEVAGWLDEAMDDSSYGMMARLVRILQLLDRGEHAAAADAIQVAERLLPAGMALDRRLALQVFALRHALDSGAPESVVRERHAAAHTGWRQRLELAAAAPVIRGGNGLLFEVELLRGLDQLMRTHIRLDGERGACLALERLLEIERLGTMARTVEAPTVSVDELQRRLAVDGRGLLVYVPAIERTWLFTIDARSVRAFELPTTVLAVDRLARELLFAIDAGRTGGDDGAGLRAAEQAITEALLPPPIAELVAGWSRVAICGGERTGYVPFELLRLPDGRRLGAALPLSYLPSLVVGAWLANQPSPAPVAAPHMLLVACPDAAPTAPGASRVESLPFGAAEAEALTGASPEAFRVLTGSRADLTAIGAGLDGVHLATFLVHGMRDERRVDRQGLLLGDGSVLWGNGLESLSLPHWLFLGSCRAGDGRARRGDDGRHHLSGAAQLAGARVVVVPSLDVAYRPTVQLLAVLHEAVLSGAPFDEALRRARVAVAGTDGEGPIDAFLFHQHGLGAEPLVRGEGFAANCARWVWLAVCAALGAVLVVLASRRRHRLQQPS